MRTLSDPIGSNKILYDPILGNIGKYQTVYNPVTSHEFYMVLYRMIRGPYRIPLDPIRSYTILYLGISEIV